MRKMFGIIALLALVQIPTKWPSGIGQSEGIAIPKGITHVLTKATPRLNSQESEGHLWLENALPFNALLIPENRSRIMRVSMSGSDVPLGTQTGNGDSEIEDQANNIGVWPIRSHAPNFDPS